MSGDFVVAMVEIDLVTMLVAKVGKERVPVGKKCLGNGRCKLVAMC